MSNITWGSSVLADWSDRFAWVQEAVPGAGDDADFTLPGTGGAMIATTETFSVNSLQLATGMVTVDGVLSIAAASDVAPYAVLDGGGTVDGGATLTNQGTIAGDVATPQGGSTVALEILTAGLANAGSIVARNGGIVLIGSQDFSNLVAGTLTGGVYEVDGNSAAIDIVAADAASPVVTDAATITLNGAGATIFLASSADGASYVPLETTLTSIDSGGVLI